MFLYRFAVVLLAAIAIEGLLTAGYAYRAASYQYPVAWIVQFCILVVVLRASILDRYTSNFWK